MSQVVYVRLGDSTFIRLLQVPDEALTRMMETPFYGIPTYINTSGTEVWPLPLDPLQLVTLTPYILPNPRSP